ncbi:homoserine dehydrogenase [Ligilactobacillus saerimneri]|uniref:homoserine dehydrogenase n=1 Tax=Ligilactobacillus saerimneri TaxID=228229 RepID=UPI003F288102
MDVIKLGMIGLGTVGSGVLAMIQEHADKIYAVTGRRLILKTVMVRDLAKHQDVAEVVHLTTDLDDILSDPEIQIVVEVMGGIHPAKEVITQLLQAHKHVVTANKDLIATEGADLIRLARANGCDLMYEASVAGGIPILRTIADSFAADQITEVKGIVNGTTNYILTQMAQQGWTYAAALKQAQQLGFAESDPTNDVQGKDAAYKMMILSQFSFGTQVNLEDFETTGIDAVAAQDVRQATAFGYVLKLVGVARLVDQGIFVEVAPALVSVHHPLAGVNNENNAVMVRGQAVGDTLFYGPGAGALPTANSVLSDITTVVKNMILKTNGNSFNRYSQALPLATPAQVKDRYYLALTLPDQPGEMQKLTTVMAQINASFSQIVQQAGENGQARVMIITHTMSKEQLHELQQRLTALGTITLHCAYRVIE